MTFNEFYWHDSIIKNIAINRADPGIKDEIIFDIAWAEQNNREKFVFESVYWAELKLNFGVIAQETILNAAELDSDNIYLANFYSKWKGAMNEVKLNTYKIALNSTGGEITIIAKSFRIEKYW